MKKSTSHSHNLWRFLTFGVFAPLVITTAVVATPAPADAWSKPTVTVTADSCEVATATVHNTEGGAAHVVSSSVFTVGATVPGHGDLSEQFTGTGTVVVTVTLDFPDHGAADPVSFTFTQCPPPTTEPPTTVPPSTDTTPPPSSTPSTTPPTFTVTAPHFTG